MNAEQQGSNVGCLAPCLLIVGLVAFEAFLEAFQFGLAAFVAVATIAALAWLRDKA